MAFNATATTVKRKIAPTPAPGRPSIYRGITPKPGTRLTRDDSFNSTRRTTIANKSRSLEALNFMGERERTPIDLKYEEYNREYNKYISKKFLAKMLLDDKEKKEEKVSTCLVSLKLEYDELLNKNLKLKNDIIKVATYAKTVAELNKHIEQAESILQVLRESKFDVFLKGMVNALDVFVNQLKLVDITGKEMEELFRNNVLGWDSDIYKTLRKVHEHVREHGCVIGEIAQECDEIEILNGETKELKKRCSATAETSLTSSIDKNYEYFFALALKNFNLQPDELKLEWKPISSSTPGYEKKN